MASPANLIAASECLYIPTAPFKGRAIDSISITSLSLPSVLLSEPPTDCQNPPVLHPPLTSPSTKNKTATCWKTFPLECMIEAPPAELLGGLHIGRHEIIVGLFVIILHLSDAVLRISEQKLPTLYKILSILKRMLISGPAKVGVMEQTHWINFISHHNTVPSYHLQKDVWNFLVRKPPHSSFLAATAMQKFHRVSLLVVASSSLFSPLQYEAVANTFSGYLVAISTHGTAQ